MGEWIPTPEQRARLDALPLACKCEFAVTCCRVIDDDTALGELLAKLFGDYSKIVGALQLARCGIDDECLASSLMKLFFDATPTRLYLPSVGAVFLNGAFWSAERN